MPTIKATSLRLPQNTVLPWRTKPYEHFVVGHEGCESIELRDGLTIIGITGQPPVIVLPSGAVAVAEESKK